MLYLYVPNGVGKDPWQTDKPPIADQLEEAIDSNLDIFRFNPEIDRFERLDVFSITEPCEVDEDSWQELPFKP